MKDGIEDAIDQIDYSSHLLSDKSAENQEILDWAKSSAARDPDYIRHICERYRISKTAERLRRADAVRETSKKNA